MPNCVMMKMEDIVTFLLTIIEDTDSTIRCRIYTIFVTLCEQRKDILSKYLAQIVEKIVNGLRDQDYQCKRIAWYHIFGSNRKKLLLLGIVDHREQLRGVLRGRAAAFPGFLAKSAGVSGYY